MVKLSTSVEFVSAFYGKRRYSGTMSWLWRNCGQVMAGNKKGRAVGDGSTAQLLKCAVSDLVGENTPDYIELYSQL
jgi:hypothetical protein